MNTTGRLYRLTTFGESHGEAIGGVVDGMPSGVDIDLDFIQRQLDRRRPGYSTLSSQRNEPDKLRLLSGVFEGKTTGTPIAFLIDNADHRSSDYSRLKEVFRPSHADFVYEEKYGLRDYRGGGRSSAGIMISRVVAGALAMLVLKAKGISVEAYTSRIGNVAIDVDVNDIERERAIANELCCPDDDAARQMTALLKQVRSEGDTIGGEALCIVRGCPSGLGEPEFGKLHAALASSIMSINACRAFEIGDGFEIARSKGSETNDSFMSTNTDGGINISTSSNHSGGIQGGISNGQTIFFRAAFKPIPSIAKQQITVDRKGNPVELEIQGRHDVCVLPRVLPIIESMTAMTLLDNILIDNAYRNIVER